MKKIFLFLVACLAAASSMAIPARRVPFTVRQSDGTELTLIMVGDEHFHYFVNTADGRPMLRAGDGDYRFADETELAPMRAFAALRRDAQNAQRAERLMSRAAASGVPVSPEELQSRPKHVQPGSYNGAMTGSKKGLVILMEFPDLKFLPQNDRAAYDRVFNEDGYSDYGSIGSVHDYFKDQSYGVFDLTFDVVGPYTADHEMSYYGQNMPFPGDPYGWGTIQDLRACTLPIEAVKKADAAVDFKDYDWDGDGEVDQVYIIYPGYAESSGASASTIWPHESTLSSWMEYNNLFGNTISVPIGTPRLDGVKINTYAMSQELAGTRGSVRVGIGTACHEFAHCLGFPDFYDINQMAFGMESFDLMDKGGYNGPSYNCEVPAGFTAYERWMAGWLEPTVLREGTAVQDMAPLCDKPEAYVIYNEGNHDEYLLLENRQPKSWHQYVGSWSKPGGMIVTHVEFDRVAWLTNQVNTSFVHQRMALVPAGKTYGTGYATEMDYRSMLFPGSRNVTELTDQSHASYGMRLYTRNSDGTYQFGAPIHDIQADADREAVSFTFKEGPDDGTRWTVTYDAGSGAVDAAVWTQGRYKESTVLPTATISDPRWSFIGWSVAPVSETDAKPDGILKAGASYLPDSDVTLYAVYGFHDGTGSSDDYIRVDEMRSGSDYVLAHKGASTDLTVYALSTLNLTGSMSKNVVGKEVEVDFSGAVPVIHNPSSDLVWSATVVGDDVTLRNGDSYLQISDGGLALSSRASDLYWHTGYGLGVMSGTMTYYVHVNAGKFIVTTQKLPTSRLFAYEIASAGGNATLFSTYPVLEETVGLTPLQSVAQPAVSYDLQGRRVTHTGRGVYLVGGRKVVR